VAISVSEIPNYTTNVPDMVYIDHQDSSTTMPTISMSSAYIDIFAFKLYSNDPRVPPKFIEHYTIKIDDGVSLSPALAYLIIEFSKS
jgi:hypothetical protein